MALDRPAVDPHDHGVSLYDDYEDVLEVVGSFLVEGLLADEAVLVIASPDHRDAFDLAIGTHVDLERARAEHRYRSLDAVETLASFRVAGRPDRDRFDRVVGEVVEGAAAGGRRVRAFGEMVAILWDAGDVWGAIELESMWNRIAQERRISLHCAYPMTSLRRSGDLRAVHAVCQQHSMVTAPMSYRTDGQDSPELRARGCSELFIADPLAVRAVRRFVVGALGDAGEEVAAGDAAVVASELAANVIRHVGSPFRVTVTRGDRAITVAVEDLSPAEPVLLDVGPDSIGGRGMMIVDALCSAWGTDVGPAGKVVWAELVRPQAITTSPTRS